MRNITKIKRSIRAISPVISVLLMIAIAVVASLVAYAWVMGYMNFQTAKVGQAIQIPSYAEGDDENHMWIYVQNVGEGAVTVGNVYINDALVTIDPSSDKEIGKGETVALLVTLNSPWNAGEEVAIKVVTTSGTFMEVSGTGSSGSDGAPAHGDATSISITPESTSVPSGGTATFIATASDGAVTWDISSLTAWSITAGAGGSWASNVYTAANAGDWTVTGQYSGFSDTAAIHVDAGSVDHVTVSPDTADIDAGDTQTYSLMAYDTVGNSWDVSTSATWEQETGAGGSWAANVYTSENDGAWDITGTYSGKSDTAQLTVNPALPAIYVSAEADLHPTSPDIGSLTNFANMQSDTASTATLVESNAAAQTWITPTSDSGGNDNWGDSSDARDGNTNSYADETIGENARSSYLTLGYSSTTGTKLSYWMTVENGWVNRIQVEVHNTGGSWQVVYDGAPTTGQWEEVTFTSRTSDQMRIRVYNDESGYGDRSNWARIHEVAILSEPLNYRLDQEVQFQASINSAYTRLEIKTGAFSAAEGISVERWNGASWTSVGALTANTVNAFNSVPLTGNTLQLRFVDATQSSDTTSNNWQIDYVRLVAP